MRIAFFAILWHQALTQDFQLWDSFAGVCRHPEAGQ
jgi:hypothetical protein